MAKIIEDLVVIKFSKIVKSDQAETAIVDSDIESALEQVAQELAGQGVIVEIEKA